MLVSSCRLESLSDRILGLLHDGDGRVGVGDGDVGVLLQARKSLRQDMTRSQ